MDKINYFVLIIALILVTLIFTLYNRINIYIIIGITLLSILGLILFLIYIKKRQLKEIENEREIFSLCYIKDDINFSKFMELITKENKFKLEECNCSKFIELLLENKLLIKLDKSMSIDEIIEKINKLLKKQEINSLITKDEITKNDSEKIKYRRNNKIDTFIYDLNMITKIIRNSGYELVQVYPIINNKKKNIYYMMIIEITSLLDLNEIGFMR